MSSDRLQPYVQGHINPFLVPCFSKVSKGIRMYKGEQCSHGKTYKADGRLKRLWTFGITVIFEHLIKLSSPGQVKSRKGLLKPVVYD